MSELTVTYSALRQSRAKGMANVLITMANCVVSFGSDSRLNMRAAAEMLEKQDEEITRLTKALDKARRFKGWRIRIDDAEGGYVLPHWVAPRAVLYKTPLVGLKEARELADNWCAMHVTPPPVTIVRVYRKAKP